MGTGWCLNTRLRVLQLQNLGLKSMDRILGDNPLTMKLLHSYNSASLLEASTHPDKVTSWDDLLLSMNYQLLISEPMP